MASVVTCLATSAGWCFCTACASLFSACCGNDKASTIPPSASSGRKRSVLLMLLAVLIALGFQYGVAPFLVETTDYTGLIRKNWVDGCESQGTLDLVKSCAGNSGVYRVSAAATIFFALAAVAVACKPTANREAWPAKYILFIFLCGATVFIPNDPVFSDVYLHVGRIGAVFFILVQQIVLIDMAYDWNDSWVTRSNEAEAEEVGSGKKWLGAIMFACSILFIASIVALGFIFAHFTGCPTNNAFISVTLVLNLLVVGAQMTSEQGSLLASACIFCWSTFLCYTAVSKNPDARCNPMLGELDTTGIVLGLIVTIISLGWTGFSYTAEDKLNRSEPKAEEEPKDVDPESGSGRKVTGVVAGASTDDDEKDDEVDEAAMNNPQRLSNSWKLNAILMSVTCWSAMALTNWGSIVADGDAANPQVGRIGMWMVVASQWLVLSLYLWTLVAPRLFPGRDFD